jgi:glyoxylase-like metal-dependent hydrolase (beta-lactamase superfamily II)
MIRADNRSPMTLDGTRTYLLGSLRPLVIDPGPADETHLEAVQRLLDGAAPVAIVLTHGHSDHSGNAAALAAATGAPLRMGRGAPKLPFSPERVDGWLGDGDALECDAGVIEVHATPGHTPEHLAFSCRLEDGGRALFAGDLFLGVGDTTLVSHPHGSVRDYLQSLDAVAELRPTVVYPAHGPALRRPERAIGRYRQHRLERIEQVRAALVARPEIDPEGLVGLVYGPDLDPRLRGGALGSVRAILAYLSGPGGP